MGCVIRLLERTGACRQQVGIMHHTQFDIVAIGLLVISGFAVGPALNRSFKTQQMLFPRVKSAFATKESLVRESFKRANLTSPPTRVLIRVFKREQALELWSANSATAPFQLAKTYKICASSGALGPKRAQGDHQVPEGFYEINRFNPMSNYHLSLGVDYPNRSDKILGGGRNLGGDIFIHGNCVTIGCVPMGDDAIEELYVIAVEARAGGQTRIPVHIFPARLDERGLARLQREYAANKPVLGFWENLKAGYDYFEQHHGPPAITVDKSGKYSFADPAK